MLSCPHANIEQLFCSMVFVRFLFQWISGTTILNYDISFSRSSRFPSVLSVLTPFAAMGECMCYLVICQGDP